MKKIYPSSVIGVDLGEAWSLKCRGIVYGIIGKIQFFPGRQSVISDALVKGFRLKISTLHNFFTAIFNYSLAAIFRNTKIVLFVFLNLK